MANPKSFPLVRGRTMRVTKTDGCCQPVFGPDNQVVSDGFVSVALTANINEPEEIVVTNANGQTCVRDAGCPEFQGYNVEITFCNVTPCLFSIVTGQPTVVDVNDEVVGFRMNSQVRVCDEGFALEVWMGVPGVACGGEAAEGAFGYLLLPCLQAGVIGDFTIENAAITFTVTGAATKGGNGWGIGPYNVVESATGTATTLPDPLDPDDHLYAVFTTIAPPPSTDGCVALTPASATATGATAGVPGTWTPAGSAPPASVANLIAGTPNAVVAAPTNIVTPTQKALTTNVATLTVGTHTIPVGAPINVALIPPDPVFDGNYAVTAIAATTISYAKTNANITVTGTGGTVTYRPVWTQGQYVQTLTAGTGGRAHWSGTAWVSGAKP